jgi:ATP-dependent DNA ligase
VLSAGKGAAHLRKLLAGVQETLDGEWMQAAGELHVFDLPDHGGTYDERRLAMFELWIREKPRLHLVSSYPCKFPQVYESLKQEKAEGVVLKRRHSLYTKQARSDTETRDWLKRRFVWDKLTKRGRTMEDGEL